MTDRAVKVQGRKSARQAFLDEVETTFGSDDYSEAVGRILDHLGIYVAWKPYSCADETPDEGSNGPN